MSPEDLSEVIFQETQKKEGSWFKKPGKRNKWDIKPQLRGVQVQWGEGIKNRFGGWGVVESTVPGWIIGTSKTAKYKFSLCESV